MHNTLLRVQPARERPASGPRHTILSAAGTSVVQLTCDSELDDSLRDLDHVTIGSRQWVLVDLTMVTSATQFACTSLVTALDRVSPDRFCIVAAPRSPWVGEMLPKRARRVTFQSVGDALQMLVLAEEGFGAAWLGSALIPPVKLDVSQSWLARCPLAPLALARVARHELPASAKGLVGTG